MGRYARDWRPELDEDGQLCDMDVSGWIRTEFRSAEFGDKRLTDRLIQLGDELGSSPAESIPAACDDWASTKATYRFCDNESVEPNEILSAHKQEQRSRLSETEQLLIVSDTTYLTFPRHPSKEGLGDISSSDIDVEGVKLHTSIGLRPDTQQMTGVIDQQALIEDQQTGTLYDTNGKDDLIQLESDQEKWIRGDRQARDWLADDIHSLFIHDRGADSFAFYTEVVEELENAGFIVRADEIGESDDPIQWVLLTTESVTEIEDSLTVIDYYSLRWRIEDWHKVLKTGCKIEDRQLQTWERMEVLLSVYSVIAWKVLELRELARGEDSLSPEVVLSEAERAVLEAKFPELRGQGSKAYAVHVAKLGGYLDRGSDPPPGWQTMWKGLQKLRMWAEGYELGAE